MPNADVQVDPTQLTPRPALRGAHVSSPSSLSPSSLSASSTMQVFRSSSQLTAEESPDPAAAARELRRRRQWKRRKVAYQEDTPKLAWGVVAEPHMTPLLAVNLFLEEFGVALVTVPEATAAVEHTVEHYNSLTQITQDTSPGSGDAQRRRQRSRRSAGTQESVLTSLSLTTATEQRLTRRQTMQTDVQEALFLDVLKDLCAVRGLHLSRLSYQELKRLGGRLSVADVVPRQRAIVVADRREPVFATLTAMSRRRAGSASMSGATVASSNTGTRPDGVPSYGVGPPYVQIVAMAAVPVPWRRVARKRMPFFSLRECVVAVVERKAQTPGVDEAFLSQTAAVAAPTVQLLGVGDEEAEEMEATEEGRQRVRPCTSRKRPRTPPLVRSWSQATSDLETLLSFVESTLCEDAQDYSRGTPAGSSRSPGYSARLCSPEPIFSPADAIPNDPFFLIPRVDVRGDARRRRRTWVERLFLTNTTNKSAALSRLYSGLHGL